MRPTSWRLARASQIAIAALLSACSSPSSPTSPTRSDASIGPQAIDATGQPATGGSRLQPLVLTGDDGSQQVAGWYDTARDEECAFELAADGEMHCLPAADGDMAGQTAQEIQVFEDAACTAALYFPLTDLPCTRKKYFALQPTAACTPSLHYFAYGAALSSRATLHYRSANDSTCRLMPADRTVDLGSFSVSLAGLTFYPGQEVALAEFVKARKSH